MSTSPEKRIMIPSTSTNEYPFWNSVKYYREVLSVKCFSSDMLRLSIAGGAVKRSILNAFPILKYFK